MTSLGAERRRDDCDCGRRNEDGAGEAPLSSAPSTWTFYRIVKGDPPTRDDFVSNQAKGRIPRRILTAEELRRWDGLSVFETEAQARRQARRHPFLGRFIARLRIVEGGPIHYQRTNPDNRGHHSVWGSPDILLTCVEGIASVYEPLTRET